MRSSIMTEENILQLFGMLAVFCAVGFAAVLYMLNDLRSRLNSRKEEEMRDDVIDAVMAGVRAERQEMQASVHNVERNLSSAMSNLMGFVTTQMDKNGEKVNVLNETTRNAMAEMNKVMHRQLLALQSVVDERFASIVQANMKANEQLTSVLGERFDVIRSSVDANLEKVRTSNEKKLEEMRSTVQEKLDKTLSDRLSASFRTVDEKLSQVEQGLGEMRLMAQSVRDLKGVLTNVKTRGTYGETQLSVILSNILTPAQYAEQVQLIPGEKTAVDFAIRMPGAGDNGPCWLPIDSKFPMEDYQRLLDAEERGDSKAALDARHALSRAVLIQAKSIRDKYLKPPYTTEFAVMYLPSEGLYAEVIRLPELFERLQREFRITPAGPTVVSALINSLQLGFVTLALQERSGEVWRVLSEVKSEFLHFAEGFEKVQKKFGEAQRSLDAMKTRQNVMQKKMNSIDSFDVLETEPLEDTQSPLIKNQSSSVNKKEVGLN